ncbi:hypothetical protein [Methylovorus mays]|uniref:hypothetical protein n=1 Tax=Methylovorus mays TaxID=184077 RepID=UPI001E4DFACB|nr:hypothetical protein [Methylovorus mays]MCB5206573.1 hypothetical protein [Methylovorus mays]
MHKHQNFHQGQYHWLVNLAASSLILFAVVGSVSLFAPEIRQSATTHSQANIIRQDDFDRSYLHQASPDKEILNLKPKAENNAFTRVRKVTA